MNDGLKGGFGQGNVLGNAIQALANRLGISVRGGIFATAGILSSSPTSGIGYRAGAGGFVQQTGTRSDPVTLNTICGRIHTQTTSLASGDFVDIQLNNSSIALNDVVVACAVSSPGIQFFKAEVREVLAAGSAVIRLTNVAPSSTTDAAFINFVVIKAVQA